MWIIDASGKTDEVIARVKALTYDSFIKATDEVIELAKARHLVEKTKPLNDVTRAVEMRAEELQLAEDRRAALDDDDERAAFERAKTFVLGELSAAKTPYSGVTARPFDHPGGAGGGRISIDVSEYERI